MSAAALAAGRLRERVDIHALTETPDGAGGKTKSWGAVATVWAEVLPLSGGEALAQGIARNTQMYRVTIRFRSDVTPRNRLAWNGQTLNIRTCGDPDNRRAALVMTAESGAPEA